MADTQKINLKALIEPIEIDIKTGKLDSANKKLKEFYGYIQEIKEQLAISDSWGDPVGLVNQYGIVINTLKEVSDLIKQMEKESGRLAGQITIAKHNTQATTQVSAKQPIKLSSNITSEKNGSNMPKAKPSKSMRYTFKGNIEQDIGGRTIKAPGFVDDKGGTRFIADIQKAYLFANEKNQKEILKTFRELFYSQENDVQKWMLAELKRSKGAGYDDTVQIFWDELRREQSDEQKKAFDRAKRTDKFSFSKFGSKVGADKEYQNLYESLGNNTVVLKKGKKVTTPKVDSKLQKEIVGELSTYLNISQKQVIEKYKTLIVNAILEETNEYIVETQQDFDDLVDYVLDNIKEKLTPKKVSKTIPSFSEKFDLKTPSKNIQKENKRQIETKEQKQQRKEQAMLDIFGTIDEIEADSRMRKVWGENSQIDLKKTEVEGDISFYKRQIKELEESLRKVDNEEQAKKIKKIIENYKNSLVKANVELTEINKQYVEIKTKFEEINKFIEDFGKLKSKYDEISEEDILNKERRDIQARRLYFDQERKNREARQEAIKTYGPKFQEKEKEEKERRQKERDETLERIKNRVNYITPSSISYSKLSNKDFIEARTQSYNEANSYILKENKRREKEGLSKLTDEQMEKIFQGITAYNLTPLKERESEEKTNIDGTSIIKKLIKPFITKEGDVVSPYRKGSNGEVFKNETLIIKSDLLEEIGRRLMGPEINENSLIDHSINNITDRKLETDLETLKNKRNEILNGRNLDELNEKDARRISLLDEAIEEINKIFKEIIEQGLKIIETKYSEDSEYITNTDREELDYTKLFSLSDNAYSQFVKRFLTREYTLNSDGTKTPGGKFLTDTEALKSLREEAYKKITQLIMARQEAFDSQGWSGYSWGLLDKEDMLSLGLMTDDKSESLEGLKNAGFVNQSQLDLEESMEGTDFRESRSIQESIEQAAFRLSNLLTDYQAYQASIANYAEKTNQTYEEVDKKARENMSDVALDNLNASKIVRQIYDTTKNKYSGQISEKYKELSKLEEDTPQYNELLNEIKALEAERNKEIIKALRNANTDNRELEEILKMIQSFSGQSLFTEEFKQFSQKFNNQMSVGRSFKSGKKIPITKVTPGVDKEFWDKTGLEETPAMRRALNYGKGYAKLAPYGVTSLQEAINIINQRDAEIEQERLDLEEKNKKAIAYNEEIDRKIQEAEESIKEILETYGTKEQKDWAITRPDLSTQKITEDRATYNKAVDFLKNHAQKEEIVDIPDRKAEIEQLDKDREEFTQLLEKAKQREQEKEQSSTSQSKEKIKENDTKDTTKSDLPQEPKVSGHTSQTIETEITRESDIIGKESPVLNEHNNLMGEAIEKEEEKIKVANALADALKKEKDAFDELNNSINSHNGSGQINNNEQTNNSNNNGLSNYRGFKKNTANTVKVERLPIFFDAKNHTYIDEIGNKVMSSTKFRDILLGKDRTSIKSQEDIKRIKDASNSLNRPLSATDVGMSQSDFDFYTKNVIGSALYGDYFHAIVDNFAKTGQVDLNTLKKETETELAKYNINPDEFLGNIEANVKAYLEAYEKIGKVLGLTLSQFSEMPLGARLETANGIYEIAGTLDQLLIDQNGGGAFIDNKTGKVHGYEAFQLTFQKILALANQDWLNQNGIIKDSDGNAVNVDFNKVTSGYIAKIENGVVTYIENKLLELEEFADLIDRASRTKEGKANPLNSNEINALMNRQLATGRFQGGTNVEDIIVPNNKETDGKIVNKAIQERLKYYKEFLNAEKELYKWEQKAQTLGDDATDEQKQAYGDKIKYLEQLRDITREILNETDFTSKDGKWYANGKEISEEDYKNYQRESKRLNLQYQNNKSSIDITEARTRSKSSGSSNASSSTKNTQAIKDLIKQQKDLANYEKGLQQAELNYSQLNPAGQREMLKTIDYYKKRINELQNSGLKFDREKGSIITDNGEELLLNAQEIREIETQIGDIENKKQNDIAKQNIKYKEQRGILTQIVDSFKNEFRNLFDYRIGNEIINAFQNGVRRVIDLTKELNSNMVDLQIASGESYSNIYELSKSFNDLGRELGRSTSDVMTAANDWLRAGYNAQKAAELTRASMELSTLGMINSSDATSYLISTMKGWKLEANEVSSVVDKLTAIDFQAAVSAGDLAEAISRSSVSAQKAGLDLDTFLGYVTVVQETTQKSAEVVGSSFQTLFSRYQNAASNKFSATQEEIESGDYDEENYSNINDIETALKAVGINIRDTIDHFRDFDEIIQEIANRWDTFSNVQQAGISTSLAG